MPAKPAPIKKSAKKAAPKEETPSEPAPVPVPEAAPAEAPPAEAAPVEAPAGAAVEETAPAAEAPAPEGIDASERRSLFKQHIPQSVPNPNNISFKRTIRRTLM